MTHQFFSRFLFMIFFLGVTTTAAPALHSNASGKEKSLENTSVLVQSVADSHDESLVPSAEKKSSMREELALKKMEELAKIHRFHKERVKKHKKHGNKFWILSKLLLIVCHAAILISAFLHLTH